MSLSFFLQKIFKKSNVAILYKSPVLLKVIELIHNCGEGGDRDALECVQEESQHHLIPRLLLEFFKTRVCSLQRPFVFPENASDAPERLKTAVIVFKTVICVSFWTNIVLLFRLLHWFSEPDI